MNTNVGIWIDHKQAIIVAVTGKELHIGQIASNTERQQRRSGDSQLKNSLKPRRAIADDIQLRSYTGHINRYYDSVIAYIGNAEAIMIFGPGEAKGELKKRLEKKWTGRAHRGGRGGGQNDQAPDRRQGAQTFLQIAAGDRIGTGRLDVWPERMPVMAEE